MEELPAQYCICKKGERKKGKGSTEMIQCEGCWDWFHFDCVDIKDGAHVGGEEWSCEWCLDPIDKQGYQRWRSNRDRPKRRHQRDMSRLNGAVLDQDKPLRYSAPPTWDGKVAEARCEKNRFSIWEKINTFPLRLPHASPSSRTK